MGPYETKREFGPTVWSGLLAYWDLTQPGRGTYAHLGATIWHCLAPSIFDRDALPFSPFTYWGLVSRQYGHKVYGHSIGIRFHYSLLSTCKLSTSEVAEVQCSGLDP